MGRTSVRILCTSLRGLLRHLHRQQILHHDLSVHVGTPRVYALEKLPRALPWAAVERLLAAPDAKTAQGRRDLAILWLLATYGVRPGEVVKLRLDDIDWRGNSIRFRRSKCGPPLVFPLLPAVGELIVSYLRDGRPMTSVREVFIRIDAPHVGLSRGSIVSNLVRRYILGAGIETAHAGAYAIRHAYAVRLLNAGKPLKTISDMLGHRDPHVAYHYTKLATKDLHGVGLDVQGLSAT
jgi:site-specific recombinase XerD